MKSRHTAIVAALAIVVGNPATSFIFGCGGRIGAGNVNGPPADASTVAICGDDEINGEEECDGYDLGGMSCELLGWGNGMLVCDSDCQLDASGCGGTCGDGVLNPGEQCDGGELANLDCEALGFEGGWLQCSPDCELDSSMCVALCGNGVVDPGEACDDGNTEDWDGCTSCAITEFRINTHITGTQWMPAVAMKPDGDFTVVWASDRGQANFDIFGQRFAATGAAQGVEFQINTHTTDFQDFADVVTSAAGASVVVWTSHLQDGHGWGVFGRRYNELGVAVGTDFQVNTYTLGDQEMGSVAGNAAGNTFVAWVSTLGQDGDSNGVYGQRYDALGAPVGAETLLNTYTTSSQSVSSVGMAADGTAIAIWMSLQQNGCLYAIMGQRFLPDGSRTGPEFQVNDCTVDTHIYPVVAMTPTGEFVVAWVRQGASNRRLVFQRFDASGYPVGVETDCFVSSHFPELHPTIAIAPSGAFVIAWTDDDQASYEIFARRFDASGSPLAPEFQVNVYTDATQSTPDVALASDGSLVIVWDSFGQDTSLWGIYGQRYDSNGIALGKGQ